MADSLTANLTLTKPEVGASTDTWGNKINGDLDQIDALFTPAKALLVSAGGTAATDAAAARTNLGCGTMAIQNANTVAITGGTASGVAFAGCTLDSTPIGATTANSVRATSVQLVSGGAITFADGTNQATSASALNSPSVFSINSSGPVSAVPIFQTERADASTGALTRLLPSSVGIQGHVVSATKTDSSVNAVTYIPVSGETINRAPFFALFRQDDIYDLQAVPGGWIIK